MLGRFKVGPLMNVLFPAAELRPSFQRFLDEIADDFDAGEDPDFFVLCCKRCGESIVFSSRGVTESACRREVNVHRAGHAEYDRKKATPHDAF